MIGDAEEPGHLKPGSLAGGDFEFNPVALCLDTTRSSGAALLAVGMKKRSADSAPMIGALPFYFDPQG